MPDHKTYRLLAVICILDGMVSAFVQVTWLQLTGFMSPFALVGSLLAADVLRRNVFITTTAKLRLR